MPKKAFIKKKKSKDVCREKVKSGLINTETGDWVSANKVEPAMARDMQNGYGFRF